MNMLHQVLQIGNEWGLCLRSRPLKTKRLVNDVYVIYIFFYIESVGSRMVPISRGKLNSVFYIQLRNVPT